MNRTALIAAALISVGLLIPCALGMVKQTNQPVDASLMKSRYQLASLKAGDAHNVVVRLASAKVHLFADGKDRIDLSVDRSGPMNASGDRNEWLEHGDLLVQKSDGEIVISERKPRDVRFGQEVVTLHVPASSDVEVNLGEGAVDCQGQLHSETTRVGASQEGRSMTIVQDREGLADRDRLIKEDDQDDQLTPAQKEELDRKLKEIQPEIDRAMKDLGPELQKQMEKLGPEIEKALKNAKPMIDLSLDMAGDKLQQKLQDIQPEIDLDLQKMRPDIEKQIKEAMEQAKEAQLQQRDLEKMSPKIKIEMDRLKPEIDLQIKEAMEQVKLAQAQSKKFRELDPEIRKQIRKALEQAKIAQRSDLQAEKSLKDPQVKKAIHDSMEIARKAIEEAQRAIDDALANSKD